MHYTHYRSVEFHLTGKIDNYIDIAPRLVT